VSDGFFVCDLDPSVCPGDVVAVTGPEAHHAAVVRRMAVGETVTITDGGGRGVIGRVASVSKTRIEVEVDSVLATPPPGLHVTVAQALPKADRAELAVDLMTEAGVDQIRPWAAARSQVRWTGERGDKARSKWWNAAREASKQSRRLRFPVIGECATLPEVAGLVADADCAIIMHEKATRPISECLVPSTGTVVIVIGPEGGLTDEEVRVLEEASGVTYLMGATVLRTSTAGAVAVTQVRLLAEVGQARTAPSPQTRPTPHDDAPPIGAQGGR